MPPLCHSANTPEASGACEISDLVKGMQPLLIATLDSSRFLRGPIVLLRRLVAARQSRVREMKFRDQLRFALQRAGAGLAGEMRRIMRLRAPRIVILQARAN